MIRVAIGLVLIPVLSGQTPVPGFNPAGNTQPASRIVRGYGVPALGCNGVNDVGKVYYQIDTKAPGASYFGCSQTGNGVFAWELFQPSPSGSFTIASLNIGSTGTAGKVTLYGTDGLTSTYLQANASGVGITQSGRLSGQTISPTSFSTTQNNYSPTGLASASIVRMVATGGPVSVTGLDSSSFADGDIVVLVNAGNQIINLINASGGSTAANRFNFLDNVTLLSNTSIALRYSTTTSNFKALENYLKSVSEGGTGNLTFNLHGVLTGNATSAVNSTAEGPDGEVLTGVTGGFPVWAFPLVLMGNGGGFTVAQNVMAFTAFSQNEAVFPTASGTTRSVLVPYACTLRNFSLATLNTQPTGNTLTATVMINSGTSTGITVTVNADDVAQVYTDVTHTYTLTTADRVYIQLVESDTTGTSAQIGAYTILCR